MTAAVSPVFLKTRVCVLASVHHLFSRNAVIAKLFDINYG
jgi:hypothetical protein